jgi:hypothetical protein
MAAKEAREHARKSAEQGQIRFVLKPSDSLAMFGKTGVEAIVGEFDAAAKSGRGVIVLNRALDLQPISLSPRDLEFSKLSDDVRDEVCAVFGVPKSILGAGTGSSYGASRQDARTYWERLGSIARLFDDEFSRLTGDPRVRIEHDLTDVEALQTSRTERQMRASVWVTGFGVNPREAAEYEGFDDAPIDPSITAADVRAPRPNAPPEPIEPQEDRALAAVQSWQRGAPDRLTSAPDPETARMVEAGVLAAGLVSAGCDPARSSEVASWAADVAVACVDGAPVDGLHEMRVFSRSFAVAVARSMEPA